MHRSRDMLKTHYLGAADPYLIASWKAANKEKTARLPLPFLWEAKTAILKYPVCYSRTELIGRISNRLQAKLKSYQQ